MGAQLSAGAHRPLADEHTQKPGAGKSCTLRRTCTSWVPPYRSDWSVSIGRYRLVVLSNLARRAHQFSKDRTSAPVRPASCCRRCCSYGEAFTRSGLFTARRGSLVLTGENSRKVRIREKRSENDPSPCAKRFIKRPLPNCYSTVT